jgi:serine phosphatase RsbU (regulator of sigma subunit)
MASLRFAMRAYAAQGDSPSTILAKLSGLVSISRDGHFATALCGVVDVPARRVTLANAGHLQPLLVSPDGAAFVDTKLGLPVGVVADEHYAEVTVSVPPAGTILLYTDGLVERRDEILDDGLERLRQSATADISELDALLQTILDRNLPHGSDDDTALLGLRWS